MAGTGVDASQRSSRWSAAYHDLVHAPLGLLAATRPRIWGLRAARWEPGGDFEHPRCARAEMRTVVLLRRVVASGLCEERGGRDCADARTRALAQTIL